MDKIFLRGLEVETIIGVYEWEQQVKQKVTIDVDMPTDARQAAQSDEIARTLNYKEVAKRLLEYVSESEFRLVETLAESVAEIVIREFDLDWVRVKVGKPGAVRHSSTVGIELERRRSDYDA